MVCWKCVWRVLKQHHSVIGTPPNVCKNCLLLLFCRFHAIRTQRPAFYTRSKTVRPISAEITDKLYYNNICWCSEIKWLNNCHICNNHRLKKRDTIYQYVCVSRTAVCRSYGQTGRFIAQRFGFLCQYHLCNNATNSQQNTFKTDTTKIKLRKVRGNLLKHHCHYYRSSVKHCNGMAAVSRIASFSLTLVGYAAHT